ncbi:superoxide dismutase [Niameybacter massiliensis]|uniref:superoxide dismutase n=1 Tax=Niameybacter massiliensis TaxID=1658108 RepID=UPI0006B455E5|nr:superoxide dismutase [Niameybacter massiliensis]
MYNKIDLPYAYNALEPYIGAATVETHYSKHLQTYVEKLNATLESWGEWDSKTHSLEALLANPEQIPVGIRQAVINNGGGVYNHNLYFSILSPNPKKQPEGKLLEMINKTFGDLAGLKDQLTNAAINQFGSGYGVLCKDCKGALSIKQVKNQDTPLPEGLTPILNIDVWEHAYYLDYKNLRIDYANKIWNIIDWSAVETLYTKDLDCLCK